MVDNSKDGEKEVDVNLFEDTEYPSFTDHVVQVDDTDEPIREPLRTKNILESLDTCLVSNETGEFVNFKVSEEEVIFDLSEDTKCHSFTDPTFQVVIFYDYTSNILQTKNPNKFFECYLVDTWTNKEDSLEDGEVTYASKTTYH